MSERAIERPSDQLPVEYTGPSAPDEGDFDGDGIRRGPVDTRDDRPIALFIGCALALVVAALLVVALVRTLSDTDEAADTGPGPTGALAAIVPDVAAFPVFLPPEQQAGTLAQLLASRRHDIATSAPTPLLCAAVVVDSTLEVSGRWERNGREVAATDLSQVGPPGFGDCVDDGGAPLDEGVYQFLVVDAAGYESAAGTIVVGADVVNQQLINIGSEPWCTIRLAPARAGYFDAFDLSAQPVGPGESWTIPVAATEHDLRATSCNDPDRVVSHEFHPNPSAPVAVGKS